MQQRSSYDISDRVESIEATTIPRILIQTSISRSTATVEALFTSAHADYYGAGTKIAISDRLDDLILIGSGHSLLGRASYCTSG